MNSVSKYALISNSQVTANRIYGIIAPDQICCLLETYEIYSANWHIFPVPRRLCKQFYDD